MIFDVSGLFGQLIHGSHDYVIVHGIHVGHLALALLLDALQQSPHLPMAMLHC